MDKLKQFNQEGIKKVREKWSDNNSFKNLGDNQSLRDEVRQLCFNSDLVEEFRDGTEFDTPAFNDPSFGEIAYWVDSLLPDESEEVMFSGGLWTWLTVYLIEYFTDGLTSTSASQEERWIYNNGSRSYRHYLRNSWMLFKGDMGKSYQNCIIKSLLDQSSGMADFFENGLLGRQAWVGSKPVLDLIEKIYCDADYKLKHEHELTVDRDHPLHYRQFSKEISKIFSVYDLNYVDYSMLTDSRLEIIHSEIIAYIT